MTESITARYLSIKQFCEYAPGLTEVAVRQRIWRNEMPGAMKTRGRILIDVQVWEASLLPIGRPNPAGDGPQFQSRGLEVVAPLVARRHRRKATPPSDVARNRPPLDWPPAT